MNINICIIMVWISAMATSAHFNQNVQRSKRMVARGEDVLSAADVPWHAVLTLHGKLQPMCGGVIISMRHVLTAGHCLHYNQQDGQVCPKEFRRYNFRHCSNNKHLCPPGCLRMAPADVLVFLGQIKKPDRASKSVNVTDIVLHPEWSWSNDVQNNLNGGHDIAILTLNKQQVFSDTIQDISLPNPSTDRHLLDHGTVLLVTGFGLTEQGRIPNNLQRGHIKVTKCARWNGKKLTGAQICAIGADRYSRPVDSCMGDSGGGLYHQGEDKAVLMGVVSFGERDCNVKEKGRPGVYTNLLNSRNYKWVTQELEKDNQANIERIDYGVVTLDESFKIANKFEYNIVK